MTQKMDELIIKSKNPFVSLLLPTIVTSSHILKWIFFCNIFPIIEKNTKWIPKNQKIQNPAQTHKLYVDVGPKRYLGRGDPIIGSMRQGGGVLR